MFFTYGPIRNQIQSFLTKKMKIVYFLTLFLLLFNQNGKSASSSYGTYRKLVITYMRYLKDQAIHVIGKSGGGTQCAEDLKTLLYDLFHGKKWAVEMIDASAKPQSGLLYGNIYQVGNYDQCLNINKNPPNKSDNLVRGQYCTVMLFPTINSTTELSFLLNSDSLSDWAGIRKTKHFADFMSMFKLTFGICLPRTCSIENLQKIWDHVENLLNFSVHMHFYDLLCSYENKPVEVYYFDRYAFLFFGFMFVLVTLCSFYDYFILQKAKDKDDESLLIAFSAYTNLRKLITVENTPSNTNTNKNNSERNEKSNEMSEIKLSCICGLRTLSMIWIVLGHRFVINCFTPSSNAFYLFEWKKFLTSAPVFAINLIVDTFFAISGFLLSYIFLKNELTQKPNVLHFYLNRIVRITPSLFAMILVHLSILKYFGDGPMWPTIMKKVSGSCYNTWWATLFYFPNFIKFSNQCIEQAWYLGVDTQLYVISPIFLLYFRRHPKRVFLGLSITFIAATIYASYVTVENQIGAIYLEANQVYMEKVYMNTLIRSCPWILGVFLGYLLYSRPNIKFSKITTLFLWCFSIGVLLFICWSHLLFTRNDFSEYRAAVYNSLARSFWGLSICIIILLCSTGHGGIMDTFLSNKFFKILSRLSFTVFLTHLAVLYYLSGTRRTISHFSDSETFHDFWGDLVHTLFWAFVLHLTFEAPFIQFFRILFSKKRMEHKSTNTLNQKAVEYDTNNSKTNYLICIFSFMGSNNKTKKQIKEKIK